MVLEEKWYEEMSKKNQPGYNGPLKYHYRKHEEAIWIAFGITITIIIVLIVGAICQLS